MNTSLTTSQKPQTEETISESKAGRLLDLLKPVIRRRIKNDKLAQTVIESAAYVEGFDRFLAGLVGKIANVFAVTVDYTRSLPDMIKSGKYDQVNDDITAEHFPVTGERKQDLEVLLVDFGKDMESDDVLKELDKLALRPATLLELLAFGEMYPEVQREFPISCLGSIWRRRDGGSRVPYLDGWSGERELVLHWFQHEWRAGCRFAAVRK